MTKVVYHEALGAGTLPIGLIDNATLAALPGTLTATGFSMLDAAGAGVDFTGTGLTYDGNAVTGGILTGVTVHNAEGAALFDLTRMQFDAVTVQNTFATLGFEAVELLLLSRKDLIIGSTLADVILGGAGNDVIRGGKGDDTIGGMTGNDTLTGGAGADTFYFSRTKEGHDTITDFTDLGGRTDDLISVSARAYRGMVVTEDATGVLLTFSATSSVHVDGWHAADVGRDDFLFA